MVDASDRKGKKGKKAKKAIVEEVAQSEPLEEEAAPVSMEADASAGSEMEQDAAEIDSQADHDEEEFVHESKRGPAGDKVAQKKQKKQKFVPEDESKADRDRRTIFIGNLPVETAKSKVSGLQYTVKVRSPYVSQASATKALCPHPHLCPRSIHRINSF